METLPNFGLANTATAFATLGAGLFPLLYCRFMLKQPPRWIFVYWMILVTGVFTITLHGFGETNPVWGERWLWGVLDTGSNIVVTWSIALAVLGDYYARKTRNWAIPLATLGMMAGVAWHYYDLLPGTARVCLIPLGEWGGFYPGESFLIAFSWLVLFLFFVKRKRVPREARPLLVLVALIFFGGMLLATAGNGQIVYPFLSIHAIWHIVGAFGFITLWAFNHVRFSIVPDGVSEAQVSAGRRTYASDDDRRYDS